MYLLCFFATSTHKDAAAGSKHEIAVGEQISALNSLTPLPKNALVPYDFNLETTSNVPL